jgi:hypothetical protein
MNFKVSLRFVVDDSLLTVHLSSQPPSTGILRIVRRIQAGDTVGNQQRTAAATATETASHDA